MKSIDDVKKPVAWMSPNRERLEFSRNDTVYGSHTIPLYAHPPANDVQELVEPVAWLTVDKIDGCRYPTAFKKSKYDTPLYPHPPTADVQELVEALRLLEEAASDCDIGYMDNAVRYVRAYARVVLDKWERK